MYVTSFIHMNVVRTNLCIPYEDGILVCLCVQAAHQGKDKVVEILINAGANVNMKSLSGENALEWARKQGHAQVEELLYNHGAIRHARARTRHVHTKTNTSKYTHARTNTHVAHVVFLLDLAARRMLLLVLLVSGGVGGVAAGALGPEPTN
jgi:hypothetical protein